MSDSTSYTLYHNQRCSKSRGVQQLLESHRVEFSVVNYLEDPPTAEKLMELSAKGGFPVTDLVRFAEPVAKEKGLSVGSFYDDHEWCELLAANPALIERPIVETDDDAVIGRPPERVLTLLET